MENCPQESVAALKELLMIRMDGMEKLTEERFKTSQLAINKAEEAQKLRNESQNEWRGQSKDREANFALKTDLQRIESSVKDIELFVANAQGKQSIITILISTAISLMLLFISHLFKF